jgi:hypothetical protein
MFLFILIFTLCFVIFIEWYFGSIVYRPNSYNSISINLPSLFNFLSHPFHNSFMWNREVIVGNYPFMLGIGIIFYFILNPHKFDL